MSSKDPMAELRLGLMNLDTKFDSFTPETRKKIREMLFSSASADAKYIRSFFPHLECDPEDRMPSLEGISHLTVNRAHPGRPCLRKLTQGEATYRCL